MTGRVGLTPEQSQMVSGGKSATAYLSECSVAICWQIMLQLALCECDNATQCNPSAQPGSHALSRSHTTSSVTS